jgi:hypothetical protein
LDLRPRASDAVRAGACLTVPVPFGKPGRAAGITHYGVRVLTGARVHLAALAASFTVATVATPAGVSGAILLLPFRVGVLGTPGPSVISNNLLYDVVVTPGALYRYWRQGQTGGRLTRRLVLGTLPGVIVGSIIRIVAVAEERDAEDKPVPACDSTSAAPRFGSGGRTR